MAHLSPRDYDQLERAVMNGKLPAFTREYCVQTGNLFRWFVCRVTAFPAGDREREDQCNG